MSMKDKAQQEADPRRGKSLLGSRWRRLLLDVAIILAMAAIALGTWHVLSPQSSPINYFLTKNALPAVPRAPRLPTLDPALFSGEAAAAYRVARERPALLEQMPCYCGCYLSAGHQNNLDCFSDHHAENCPICRGVALRAEKLEKAGYTIPDIKTLIDREFAPAKP